MNYKVKIYNIKNDADYATFNIGASNARMAEKAGKALLAQFIALGAWQYWDVIVEPINSHVDFINGGFGNE